MSLYIVDIHGELEGDYEIIKKYEEPTTKNNLGVEEVTALAEWTEKLTKASEDAYNKGYADGMKAQEQHAKEYRQILRYLAEYRLMQDNHNARPTAHWVERNPKNSKTCRLIECSECGEGYIVGYNVPFEQWIDGRNYCVHCGCKMVKENEDATN